MYWMVLLMTSFMLFLNHPLSFALSLFIQTVAICLIVSQLSYWIPLVLFLVFLGGILVMFMYVASLSSNEKFNFDIFSFFMVFSTSLMITLFMEDNPSIMTKSEFTNEMESILSMSSWLMYIFLTIYLFLALILIVEFLNSNKKPLRSLV
uniref:NADH-ubiquinone oxidoreductase chain 6 n=1 Tax=Streptocephalus sirindhornae TaxID=91588 RepID=A0A0U1Z645_9CRUS|nr:NADH dehydrogenase subunit 6 [Streptocephalus sirindhornae]AJP09644.1 NADH dehydrogenase subunit 6 [Streptocephalus sirindhornae]